MMQSPYKKNAVAVKAGLRKNRSGWVQKYKCTATGKYFTQRNGFEKMKTKPEIIVDALDLRAKGLSLGKIADHIFTKYGVKVTRANILYWQRKFGEKLNAFSKQFLLPIANNIHADEMFFRLKGSISNEFVYYWDCIDYDTKFLIADHISLWREETECTQFLKKIRSTLTNPPTFIHTDNSYDYPKPIRKVFGKKTFHMHFPAWKHKFKNNPIERYHNSVREISKNLRKFQTEKTLLQFLQFFGVYYNFLRPHKSLEFQTPAQKAGFGHWNWWTLIKAKLFSFFEITDI
jgi:putative transposase